MQVVAASRFNTGSGDSNTEAVPLPLCCCHVPQVGNLKATYSVHTQAGADLGGNVKDNQVRPALC